MKLKLLYKDLEVGSIGDIKTDMNRENGGFELLPAAQRDSSKLSEQLFEWTQDERRRFPHIALGLYLGASAVGLADGATGVYAMMEPRLARHLRFAGIRFEQVGQPIEFRGLRAPYYISRKALFRYLSRPLRQLLEAIAEDLRLQICIDPENPCTC